MHISYVVTVLNSPATICLEHFDVSIAYLSNRE